MIGPDARAGYVQVDAVAGYNRWAASYDRDPNPLMAVEERLVLELADDVAGLRVLDLGCGTGRYCARLARCGATVTGIDASPAMLRQAVDKAALTPFDVVLGHLDALCVPNRHFDLIVCALTLNHVEQLARALREARRVLKPGGSIIISDFHPYWILFGHAYTEFFDRSGQEHRIRCYPHRFEDYWRILRELDLQIEDLREPVIDADLIESFPGLRDYRGVPLALVLKATYRRE